MEKLKVIWIYALIGFITNILVVGRADMSSGPVTSVATVGESKVLNCSSDSAQFWSWLFNNKLIVNSDLCMLISVDKSKRYGLVSTLNQCNLVIKNVTFADAGRYKCSDLKSLESKSVAQIIVIDLLECTQRFSSNPPLTMEDSVNLKCSLKFSDSTSSNPPRLKWLGSKDGAPGGHLSYEGSAQVTNEVTKPVAEMIDLLHPFLPSYRCLLSFDTFILESSINNSCSTPAVSIYYPPQDLRIITIGEGNSLKQGGTLLCICKSNPSSEYEWVYLGESDQKGLAGMTGENVEMKKLADEVLTDSQNLTVFKSGLYGCTVRNVVNGKIHTQSASAHIKIVNPLGTTSIVFITIFVTIVGIFVIYVLVFCSCTDWKSVILV